jgi:hypothetical protein
MKRFDDSSPTKTQLDLIMEYFRNNQGRDVKHQEIVDWVVAEYKKRTGEVFSNPDRGIRILARDRLLVEVSKEVYRYDPDFVAKRVFEDLTPAKKETIMRARTSGKKKEIIQNKFMLGLGIVLLIGGIGFMLLAYPFSSGDIEADFTFAVSGVCFLIAALAILFVAITGGI